MSKTKKFVIWILFFAMLLTCGVSLAHVYAKYVYEGSGTGDIGDHSDYDLPYEVENAFTVETQEDLFNAIRYGYSHIQISENVKDPFIVTEDMSALNHSMILDINGAEIQRNSRQPILSVGKGVTLTITDSSKDKSGSLYNPVGSVLDVDGGALLVKEGRFEAGPRYWEYYGYDSDSVVKDTWVTGSRTENGVTTTPTQYPVLKAEISENELGKKKADGNVYFDIACGSIPADTYCYYVSSDGITSGSTVNFSRGSATFVYTYFVKPNTHEYLGVTVDEVKTRLGKAAPVLNTDYVQIMVYGYEKNMETAVGDGENYPHYATIKMLKGELTVNVNTDGDYTDTTNAISMGSGCFINHFGLPQTTCIYLAGGKMTVEAAGAFVVADPTRYAGLGAGTLPSGDSLNASQGRGSCISTSADNEGSLTIKDGVYRAYNLNCIQMSSGEINILGGSFQKRSTLERADSGRSAVYVASGTCNVSNAQFMVSSSAEVYLQDLSADTEKSGYWGTNVYALYASGGTLNVTDSTFDIKGNYATGLFSSSSGGADSVRLRGVKMTMTGKHVYGLYSAGGDVLAEKSEKGTLTELDFGAFSADGTTATGGDYAYGIYSEGGTLTSNDVVYRFAGEDSAAIRTRSGEVNVIGGSILMKGYNSAALYSLGGHLLSRNVQYTLEEGKSFGIYATAGDITLHGGAMTMKSRNECYGIIGVSSSATEGLTIDAFNTDITVGGTLSGNTVDWADDGREAATNGEYPASMGLFLANMASASECYISLYQCRVRSIDIGMGIRGGDAFIQSGTREGADSLLMAKNLSALAISGGSVHFGNVKSEYLKNQGEEQGNREGLNMALLKADEEAGTAVIEPSIQKHNADGTLKAESEWTDKFAKIISSVGTGESQTEGIIFNSPAPKIEGGVYTTGTNRYPSYDGVYINGGSLYAVDGINMEFTGANSDANSDEESSYVSSTIKSYAVRLNIEKTDAAKATTTTVRLPKGLIASEVGGGVCVENKGTADCNVELGVSGKGEDSTGKTNLAVITKGTDAYDGAQTKYDNGIIIKEEGKQDWQFRYTKTGGHAIRVNSGNLTVRGGYYRAASGNGVLVQGSKSSVTIENGQFMGKDAYTIGSMDYKAFVGPAASYSLKQLGGTLTVNGGTFGGTYDENGQTIDIASGVFLMGTPGNSIDCTATFNAANIVAETRGIIIMANCNVTLGRAVNSAEFKAASDFKTKGSVYSVGIEPLTEGTNLTGVTTRFGTVTVNSGIYDAHEDLPSNIDWKNNYAFYQGNGAGGYTAGAGSYFHYGNHFNTEDGAVPPAVGAENDPVTLAYKATGRQNGVPTMDTTSYAIVDGSSAPPNPNYPNT